MRAVTIAIVAVSQLLAQASPPPQRPILIQGALRLETLGLVKALSDARADTAGPWAFWRGSIDGYPVIISRTRMGSAHAAAATAVAIERFHPTAIVNQGTAGGHDSTLHVGDIVAGTSVVSIAAFKTPPRTAGRGSQALSWLPVDLVERPHDEDGEAEPAAQIANLYKIPFLGIRIVTGQCDQWRGVRCGDG
jgi:adenosylhomocysteine nucleosidase